MLLFYTQFWHIASFGSPTLDHFILNPAIQPFSLGKSSFYH